VPRDRVGESHGLSRIAVWTLATIATAIIGAVASVLIPSLLTTSTKSAPTAVRIFNPVAGVDADFKIVQRDRGQCTVGAESDPSNPDAFRCLGRRSIYDPCFSTSSARLVCLSTPWDSRAALVTATNPIIGTGRPPDEKMPWALELSNGQKCGLVGGATNVVDGLRENYACLPGGGAAYGWPNEHPKLWTIPYFAPDKHGVGNEQGIGDVAIKVAWY
jgi:hypothetical protein